MQWSVARLLSSPIGVERRYAFSERLGFGELASEVVGSVKLMRTDRGVLVQARVKTSVWTSCSRCLAKFAQPVEFEIEEVFYPKESAPASEVEAGFYIDEHNLLDLRESIRQCANLQLSHETSLCRVLCGPLLHLRGELERRALRMR